MAPAFTLVPEATRSGGDETIKIPGADRSVSVAVGLEIPEVKLFRVYRGADQRGRFGEASHRRLLAEAGINASFVQDNYSVSVEPGTIRGLNFQLPPLAQAKFVRVVRGSVFYVAVDIRSGSQTFGRHVSVELTAEGGEALFVPVGFAHGFCTLEPDTEVLYATTEYYSSDHQAGIAFDDPELAIDWPLDGREPVVSDKDRALPTLGKLRLTDAQVIGEPRFAQRPRRVLVTGGAGFVGSAVVRHLIAHTRHTVLNLDKLTSAASASSLAPVWDDPRYELRMGDICDQRLLESVFREFRPDSVIHLAAETRADRTIAESEAFLRTNTVGTLRLLQAASAYVDGLEPADRAGFRFQHISTDEVFGSLGSVNPAFSKFSHYDPLSPYSASKAAADHIVRAWGHTYGLPVLVTTCTDIFGPYQSLGELIPRTIVGAAVGRDLKNLIDDVVRDWLFVEDLAEALVAVMERGQIGSTYLIGGIVQRSSRQIVAAVADLVEETVGPLPDGRRRRDLIAGMKEAPVEDYRYYLLEQSGLEKELGWRPAHGFEAGLRATVSWYLENEGWWRPLLGRVGTNGSQSGPFAGALTRS